MTSSTRILARAPSRRVGSTTGPLKHSRLETEPKHHGDRPFANPVGRSPGEVCPGRRFPQALGQSFATNPLPFPWVARGLPGVDPQDGH